MDRSEEHGTPSEGRRPHLRPVPPPGDTLDDRHGARDRGADLEDTHLSPGVKRYDASLPFADVSANLARRDLVDQLVALAVPRRSIEDAATILHELVRNGIDHGAPCADHTLEVGWVVETARLTIDVTDCGTPDGGCPPACRHGERHAHEGRRDTPAQQREEACRRERWRDKILTPAAPDALRGRGLHLVNALSASWDVRTTAGGTTVSAVVDLAG